MIAKQEKGAGAGRKKKAGQTAKRNKIEEKSGSLRKVKTKLKERKGSYGNVDVKRKKG